MKILDKVLVMAYLQTKDEFAFRMLYQRHAQALWKVAIYQCNGDKNLAEEITQESWIRAVQGLERFEWRCSLRTWLTKIIINRCREYYRTIPNQSGLIGMAYHVPGPDHALELKDTVSLVAELPEGYRTILLLHDLEGYRHEEIAIMLDIAPGTSKSQLHQARKAFRKLFENQNK
ncbi:MAG: RNA polymerase sigma factor [Saprospiraceae bacterium]